MHISVWRKNVYYIGSGELDFEIIEQIINKNLKLELAAEAKERSCAGIIWIKNRVAKNTDVEVGITHRFCLLCKCQANDISG